MSSSRRRLASAALSRNSASWRREMQAADTGGVFENAPARLRLGADQFADLPLAHQRRRMRAGGGIGEQKLHVAGAHFAAVDSIGRAAFTLDAPADFEIFVVIQRDRRESLGIVDDERHFGCVARRPSRAAREDDIVHRGGAQALIRALAHHPAHGLDEIGLAAPVRPDDAGPAPVRSGRPSGRRRT